jgi:integrase
MAPHAVAAIRLVILTGARLREILHAKWYYVDWERGLLSLPDSKTGKKPIYLSAAAMAHLNLTMTHPFRTGMGAVRHAVDNQPVRTHSVQYWTAQP